LLVGLLSQQDSLLPYPPIFHDSYVGCFLLCLLIIDNKNSGAT